MGFDEGLAAYGSRAVSPRGAVSPLNERERLFFAYRVRMKSGNFGPRRRDRHEQP